MFAKLIIDEKILIESLRDSSIDESIDAFNQLYGRYSGKLYNLILKISSQDNYLAEEIVQRVFIKIWDMRMDVDPGMSFSSFISTIARNMLFNELHHQTVQYVYAEYVLKMNSEACCSAEEKIENKFLRQYIETLVEKLTPARKEVFILSRFDQLTVKEIAQKLNKSEKTIEKQLNQANQFIKELIEKNYDSIFLLLLMANLS